MCNVAVYELANDSYHLTVRSALGEIYIRLHDLAMDFDLANGPYIYCASRGSDEGAIVSKRLMGVTVQVKGQLISITGKLADLDLEHTLRLPHERPIMEERITLHNSTTKVIALNDFEAGMERRIADRVGCVFPELVTDQLVAIPFRQHRPMDPVEINNEFLMADFLTQTGREHRTTANMQFGYLPSSKRFSEGWAWTHGEYTLGLFKFNQEGMEFSVLSPLVYPDGLALRFGGASMVSGEPSSLLNIQAGQTVKLGVMRYETVRGNFKKAYYAFRSFLDENGCRFPKEFNPPVHWNELYDNAEWNLGTPGNPAGPRVTRPITYTKELMELEADKARDYSCESLYLDPGWDTNFGTFIWGEDWLGPRKQFIQKIKDQYGLDVSLHCPLATWMSHPTFGRDTKSVSSWPGESLRMGSDGKIIEGSVCLGSRQYLEEAERRLLSSCADGVVFLMFDGNWWNGGCWNPGHGHPVPYTMEDHCRASFDLARRIKTKYPNVLIEMHDMITGGIHRYTPVYYKYGLPNSYDENWGFEFMWDPMEDIRSGRARSLYYYNLGCNVPVYLHVDLRDDNEHCLVLWWYASTCRHFGIGGTHENPMIAEAQKLAMRRYRTLERFFKRGDFYGISEEVHVHALPDEGAFVVNLFNLSHQSRMIEGSIAVEDMGLDRNKWYICPKTYGFDSIKGTFTIKRRLAPWSAQVAEIRVLKS